MLSYKIDSDRYQLQVLRKDKKYQQNTLLFSIPVADSKTTVADSKTTVDDSKTTVADSKTTVAVRYSC